MTDIMEDWIKEYKKNQISSMESYKEMVMTPKGRDQLIRLVVRGLLRDIPDEEGVPELIFNIVKEWDELLLGDLNKLYKLSLENEKYKELYNFCMDMYDGKGVAYEHIQELMESQKKINQTS